MIHQQEYNEIKKHLSLEHKLQEQEEVIEAFRRVKEGGKFSINDLQIVQRTLMEQSNVSYRDRTLDLGDAIFMLERESELTKDMVSKSRKRLKKRGLDLDRLRRQRRLQHEKMRQERELGV